MPAQDFRTGAKPQKGFEMVESKNATDGLPKNVGGDAAPAQSAAMLDVQGVATLLDCSTRHVYRLSDMGRMPRPVKLGALVRWSRQSIQDWIAQGCPNCKNVGAR